MTRNLTRTFFSYSAISTQTKTCRSPGHTVESLTKHYILVIEWLICGVIKWIDINSVTSESDDVMRQSSLWSMGRCTRRCDCE